MGRGNILYILACGAADNIGGDTGPESCLSVAVLLTYIIGVTYWIKINTLKL